MDKKDVPYYVGLIAGLIAGSLIMGALGFTGIIQLLGGLCVGVAGGVLVEKIWPGREPPE